MAIDQDQRDHDRSSLLKAVYAASKGDTTVRVVLKQLQASLSFDRSQLALASNWLADRKFILQRDLAGGYFLTAAGVVEAQRLEALPAPSEPITPT